MSRVPESSARPAARVIHGRRADGKLPHAASGSIGAPSPLPPRARTAPALVLATSLLLAIAGSNPAPAQTLDSFGFVIPPAECVQLPPEIEGTPTAVTLLLLNYQRNTADTLAQRLLAEAERRHGERSLEAAEALDVLVRILDPLHPRRSVRARPLAERAFAIKDSLVAPEDPRRAPSLDHLAALAAVARDTPRAWALAERSGYAAASPHGSGLLG